MSGITKKEQFYKKLLIDYSYKYLHARVKNNKVKAEEKVMILLRIASSDIARNQKHELSGEVTLSQVIKRAYKADRSTVED